MKEISEPKKRELIRVLRAEVPCGNCKEILSPWVAGRSPFSMWAGIYVLILLAFLTGCSRPTEQSPPSVVLISIDTCRADHLGCYGYSKSTTPNIDSFAESAALYVKAFSSVPITLPSHSTILTGLYPINHSVRDNVDYILPSSNATLAEILRNEGYETGAVIGSFVMDGQFGLEQGFDFYDDSSDFRDGKQDSTTFFLERGAEEVSQVACEWLDSLDKSQPFFLFVHYFDPHGLYKPPEPFATRFKESPYDGEIAYVDWSLRKLFDKLKERDSFHDSMIILTSDHGESLGEHGENSHAFFIYQSTIHVPLIVKRPGQKTGAGIETPVSLVDIVPTVLGELNVPHSQSFDGVNISTEATSEDKRDIFMESLIPTKYGCSPLWGVAEDRWKFIDSPTPELYDLLLDSSESNNLHYKKNELADRMQGKLGSYSAKKSKDSSGEGKAVDRETLNRLESLGYVAVRKVREGSGSQFDAKDFIEAHENLLATRVLIQQGKYDEVEKICREILAQAEIPDCYRILGRIAFKNEDMAETVDNYEKYLQIVYEQSKGSSEALVPRTSLAAVHNNVGLALSDMGENERAIENLRKAVGLDPGNGVIHSTLGDLYFEQGLYEKSIAHYEESLNLDPHSIPTVCSLAWVLSTAPDEAKRDGRKALALLQTVGAQNGSHPMPLDALAAAYAETGNFTEAARFAQQALTILENTADRELYRAVQYRAQLYMTQNPYRQSKGESQKPLSLIYKDLEGK